MRNSGALQVPSNRDHGLQINGPSPLGWGFGCRRIPTSSCSSVAETVVVKAHLSPSRRYL